MLHYSIQLIHSNLELPFYKSSDLLNVEREIVHLFTFPLAVFIGTLITEILCRLSLFYRTLGSSQQCRCVVFLRDRDDIGQPAPESPGDQCSRSHLSYPGSASSNKTGQRKSS